MQTKTVDKIFEVFESLDPVPQTELKYENIFTLLVSVVLSAQATDISVNKATKELFACYDTPELIFGLGEENLKKYIRTIGLYNTKAKNIIALCRVLIADYNSEVPNNFEELIKLPGVGRKTANVVLNCAHGLPTVAVDTHVFRVSKRLGLASGNNPDKVENELLKIIPTKWLKNAHHWLILHGRYICKARKPLCSVCPVRDYCKYYKSDFDLNKKIS